MWWCDKRCHLQLQSVTPVLWSSHPQVCWVWGRKQAAEWWWSQSWPGRRKCWTWAAIWGTGSRRGRWCQTCRLPPWWCLATAPGSAWLTLHCSHTCGETERTACDMITHNHKYGIPAYCFIINEKLTSDTFSVQSAKHVNLRDCLADLNASTWLLWG